MKDEDNSPADDKIITNARFENWIVMDKYDCQQIELD